MNRIEMLFMVMILAVFMGIMTPLMIEAYHSAVVTQELDRMERIRQ